MAEDKNLVIVDNREIQNLIYTIRDKQVMIDSDLATLYQVTTKRLNEQVRRNKNRFPSEFMFRLTAEEYEYLRSQNATSSEDNAHGGRRYMPYVFTEQGIAMLSAVLKSDVAVEVSVNILNILCKKKQGVDVVIATAGKGSLSAKDITKFNAQYPKLSVKTTTDFHDRFLIIDKTEVYHIGASIKDAGKKSFGITKIEDADLVKGLVHKVR